MVQFDGVIGLLDSRSYGTIWFWLALFGMWSFSGRAILDVPVEVLNRARLAQRSGQPDGPEVITLLDWLSLTLPRWRMGRREGAAFLGVTAFMLSSLAIMGFGYDLEMAQALALILVPFWLLFWARVALARRLAPVLAEASDGALPPAEAGARVIRHMVLHRRLVTVLSVLAILLTVICGALWALLHPIRL